MITSFFGEYRFLSNFWPCEVFLDGMLFKSVEHAYVAAKTEDLMLRSIIQNVQTPSQAKQYGKTLKLRNDWDIIKLHIMRNLLEQKFKDPVLKQLLSNTKPHQLIEGNSWGDKFWGQCPLGDGKNHLGKMLMEIRDNIFELS